MITSQPGSINDLLFVSTSDKKIIHVDKKKGSPVRIKCFVDTDPTGEHIIHHSYSGILLYINQYLIRCHFKSQNTVESATFGYNIISASN